MAATVDQFGKALVASGLLPADEVKAIWEAVPAGERPKDGEGFAKLLTAKGKLTEFQAGQLLAGRGKSLVMGDYVVEGEIGAGGMGHVYKARHRRMKRVVALKVMAAAAMKDEAAVKRFQREVEAAARLEHPNIVTAYDAGRSGDVNFLVMQFVDGGDLSSLVKKAGPLPIDKAADYVIQTARGLAFAHAEGVIHRDIKPANLLLDKKGVVKILDMGLARFEDGGDGLTATEQVMGTVDYMSPEQAADTKHADARADIYSLGCTLWYLLTARRLYDGDTMVSRLMKHRDGALPSLVKERDDAPWPLEQAFHKMIAKSVDDRFQTMDQVMAALEPFSGGSQSGGGKSSGGMGSSVLADKDLQSFLQGMGSAVQKGGPKTAVGGQTSFKPGTAASPSLTAGAVEATAAFKKPEEATDPKSEMLVKAAATRSKSTGAAAKPQATMRRGSKKPPVKRLAAGFAGAIVVLALGVWLIIRNKDGSVKEQRKLGEGETVSIQTTDPAATATPPEPSAATLPDTGNPAETFVTTPTMDGGQVAGAWEYGNWKSLLDANGLAGWTGIEQVRLENGVLVADGRGQTFPRPPGEFSNFEVEVEFRLVAGGNSGLGVRYGGNGNANDDGLEIQMLDTPAFPEVAPMQRCAGIYQMAAPEGDHYRAWPEWNTLRVRCLGRTVEVDLNDVTVTRADLNLLAASRPTHAGLKRTSGTICLCPHTGRSEYQNLRIREARPASVPASPAPPPIAADWEGLPDIWTIDGTDIHGSTVAAPLPFNTFLASKRSYGDFELSCRVKMGVGNSGIQVRSQYVDASKFIMRGPQVDIGSPFWGSLYDEKGSGMMQAADQGIVDRLVKADDFNDLHVRCVGNRVTITLNGTVTVDREFPAMQAEGLIGLQLHNKPCEVTFRDLSIRELNADGSPKVAANAPTPDGGGPPTPVLAAGLNTPDNEMDPWPSADGIRCYVSRADGIYVHVRRGIGEPFGPGFKVVPVGRMPTLSTNELEIVYVAPDVAGKERPVFALRPQVGTAFDPPGEIPFLNVGGTLKGPAMAADDFTLYFTWTPEGTRDTLLSYARRAEQGTEGKPPQPLAIRLPGGWKAQLTWPWISRDGLTLLCTEETPDHLPGTGRLLRSTRSAVDQPFGEPSGIIVGGRQLYGRAPRIIEATGELMFSGTPALSDMSTWPNANWEVWLAPGFASATGASPAPSATPPSSEPPIVNATVDDDPTKPRLLAGHTSVVFGVAACRDNEHALTASWDKTLRRWHLPSGKEVNRVDKAHPNNINCLALSPDGKWAATGASSFDVKLWDLASFAERRSYKVLESATIVALEFSPDSKNLLIGCNSGLIRLVGVEGDATEDFAGHVSRINDLAFLPSGNEFVSVSYDRSLRFWKRGEKNSVGAPITFTAGLSAVAVSHDGKLLATGRQGAIELWNLPERTPAGSLVPGNTSNDSLVFMPGGRFLASGSQSQMLRVWSLGRRDEAHRFNSQNHGTNMIDVTPDGKYFVSAGGYTVINKLEPDGDYRLHIWPVPEFLSAAPKP